jgi:uncharacterized protein
MLSGADYVLAALAACAAGIVNALAGGGTLISFPALTAIGLPAVAANVTSTMALWPGFVGSALALRRDLTGQRRRILFITPLAAVGAVLGGLLLFWSGDRTFEALVPWLVLSATALLASQDAVGRWLRRRMTRSAAPGESPAESPASDLVIGVVVGVASIYGGYFGAGLGVILLATLGLFLADTFTRINALKNVVALVTNLTAAALFAFSDQVIWSLALVMALAALTGGAVGGRLASRVRPGVLRQIVVAIGATVGLVYLLR